MTSTRAKAARAIAAMTMARGARRRKARRTGAMSARSRSRGIVGSDHARSNKFGPERFRREFACDAPIAQNDEPVADGKEFVEILGDQEQRSAGLAGVAECRAHRLGAARVETPGGVEGDDEFRCMRELAGQDD